MAVVAVALWCVLAVQGRVENTMTEIFHPDFRSLQLMVNDNIFMHPVLIVDGMDYLTVEFDELAEDRRFLRYSIVHCDASWQPSALAETEYLDGFNLGEVTDYEYSQATTTHYVHYRITLPDGNMRPTLSGNYLLRVFDEQNPEDTLLQARFYVSEQRAGIMADVTSNTDIDINRAHQQLSLKIDCSNVPVQSPFADLVVYVQQNRRLDNEVKLTNPMRVVGRTAVYEHLKPLIFPAGNEFRRFETVTLNYPGMRVEEVGFYAPFYHASLTTDEPRRSYQYDSTQQGRFMVRNAETTGNSQQDADYVVTHFSLYAPELRDRTVFLNGDFVNQNFNQNSQMAYNPETGLFERSMLLKQGSYNYQYLTGDASNRGSRTEAVEGDCYETNNEYTIKVYTRLPGERYDRLIGYSTVYYGN
ncbi:MAG: DUF5103 domain-containing protein [Muribaculaceae bacterium]|nr:DUF5103 domain-containing protein [Muribaculaceae bacterium]